MYRRDVIPVHDFAAHGVVHIGVVHDRECLQFPLDRCKHADGIIVLIASQHYLRFQEEAEVPLPGGYTFGPSV